jgi:hypothetical protein
MAVRLLVHDYSRHETVVIVMIEGTQPILSPCGNGRSPSGPRRPRGHGGRGLRIAVRFFPHSGSRSESANQSTGEGVIPGKRAASRSAPPSAQVHVLQDPASRPPPMVRRPSRIGKAHRANPTVSFLKMSGTFSL